MGSPAARSRAPRGWVSGSARALTGFGGGEVRAGVRVEELLFEDDTVVGVRTDDGAEFRRAHLRRRRSRPRPPGDPGGCGVGRVLDQVEGEHGQSERIGQLRLVPEEQPRLVFMHIAKAAGSTVNAYLASHYAKGSFLLHLESEKAWRSNPSSPYLCERLW